MQDENGLILRQETPSLEQKAPADIMPPNDRNDVTNLNEDHLRGYIISGFQNMVKDKQDYGWINIKKWNIDAYYQQKYAAMNRWPWPGASAFRSAMTATITDTSWANVQAGIWVKPDAPVLVPGVQNEDIRAAKILEKYLNWQTVNEIQLESQCDKHLFRKFLHGTAWTKQMFDLRSGKIKVYSLDLENCFVPVDATGLQKDGSDMVIQVIPLKYNDVQVRKGMKIYRNADLLTPGIDVNLFSSEDILRRRTDLISGSSLDTMARRDNYYILEVHLTYIPPMSARPMDLIVWIQPNGGIIQRIRQTDGKRPFADDHAYPYGDRYYSQGIPEKIKPEQEKYDYADKQYTDAMDKANNVAAFVESTSEFDKTRKQRVLGGIYPKGKGGTVEWEPQPPIERGFGQERTSIWEMALQKTGVTDVMIGRNSNAKTLGEIEIRQMRTDVRFKSVFGRTAKWWNQVITQIYELNDRYVPKSRIEEVMGYNAEGYTINEIFPKKNGELVNYNFSFSGGLLSDRDQENEQKTIFYETQLKLESILTDPATIWRVSKELSEARGVRNYESIVPRPKEAYLMSVHEFISRVVSGQRDLQVRPGIDTEQYIFELQLFMQTETAQVLEDYQKQILADAFRRCQMMADAEARALLDIELVREGAKFNAIQNPSRMELPLPVPPVRV